MPEDAANRWSLRRATEGDEACMASMFSDYLGELARHDPEIDATQSFQEDWLHRSGELFPFWIEVDEAPRGFALLMGRRYAEAIGEEVDWFLHDFYLRPEVRAQGLADFAVEQLVVRFPGRWGLDCIRRNRRAHAFWERALGDRTGLVRGVKAGKYTTFRFLSPEADRGA